MKKTKNLLALCFMTLAFLACDSDNMNIPEDLANTDEDNQFICGLNGPTSAKPNESLTYSYTTFASNPEAIWTITSGDIAIIEGQGTSTVILNFGNDFTGGTITVTDSQTCLVGREILLQKNE